MGFNVNMTVFNRVQLSKSLDGIVVMFYGIVIYFNCLQLINTPYSIYSNDYGRFMFSNLEQAANAYYLMD